jgi:hypothetical protein
MAWYRTNWYWIGPVFTLAALAYLAVQWSDLSTLGRLLLANFALLPLHEFEEYGWPGGEPAIMNKVIQPSSEPDRYPLNQLSALVVNVFAAYPFLLIAVFFPGAIWLGFGAVVFWFGQFVIHGILTNVKLKTLYNPGFLTTVVGIGFLIYFMIHVISNDLASAWDWIGGILLMIGFAVVFLVKMTYTWLADRNSKYPFTDAEMKRWNVDARIARAAPPSS